MISVELFDGRLSELKADVLLEDPGAQAREHGPEATDDRENLPEEGGYNRPFEFSFVLQELVGK